MLPGRETYTTHVLKNNPSPTPFSARPAINIPSLTELASTAAPIPNTAAPTAIPLNLPNLSARCPPKREERAAGIRIVETTRPCTVEERAPKVARNWGMVVRGPIMPMSRLGRLDVETRKGKGRGTRRARRRWR
jgi:hypothetical protein